MPTIGHTSALEAASDLEDGGSSGRPFLQPSPIQNSFPQSLKAERASEFDADFYTVNSSMNFAAVPPPLRVSAAMEIDNAYVFN